MAKSLMIPVERIEKTILLIRGQKVIIDTDLAELYGVTTKALNQSVTRNLSTFLINLSMFFWESGWESWESVYIIAFLLRRIGMLSLEFP